MSQRRHFPYVRQSRTLLKAFSVVAGFPPPRKASCSLILAPVPWYCRKPPLGAAALKGSASQAPLLEVSLSRANAASLLQVSNFTSTFTSLRAASLLWLQQEVCTFFVLTVPLQAQRDHLALSLCAAFL